MNVDGAFGAVKEKRPHLLAVSRPAPAAIRYMSVFSQRETIIPRARNDKRT